MPLAPRSVARSANFPALAVETIAGFIEALVEHCTGAAIRVEADRPELGTLVFRASQV